MVDYAFKSLFEAGVDKQISITYNGGSLGNGDLIQSAFELTESLCSNSELTFGSCEASCVRFTVGYGTTPLIGKTITVKITPSGATSPLQIGVYKIDSDQPTADRRRREVVAYDALYDIINAEVSDWYVTLLPSDSSTVTLKQFRDSFFSHFGITQETVSLPNDQMIVAKTIDPSELSGATVIRAICEINGCFGHINRSGKFEYKFLEPMIEGLYPSETLYPTENLYPAEGTVEIIGANGSYISATYEDYETARIDKVQIRNEDNDIGAIYGTGTNCYVIQDNFLVYGMSAASLATVAQNVYVRMSQVQFRPAQIYLVGNPCYEVGDGVQCVTSYQSIKTYILQRTLKGIQALFDTYTSTSSEYQPEQVNSVNHQIIQLRGRTNTLERTVDETVSTVSQHSTELGNQSTRITQNANAITAEVTRASTAEGNLSSRITVNANAITTKVTKGSVSSEISQEAGQITISSNRLVINSTNFKLAADGTINASNADLSGKITASSGLIGGFTIASSSLYNGKSSSSASSDGVYIGTDAIALGSGTKILLKKDGTGKIGGYTITASSLYSNKSSLTANSDGIYIGTDGISLGRGSTFKVTNSGAITATSGAIGGFTIGATSIYKDKSSLTANTDGVYIGADGISLGSGSTFKITKAGELTVASSSGSITLGSSSGAQAKITPTRIQFGYTYIEKDVAHFNRYTTFIDYYSEINGDEITLYRAYDRNIIISPTGMTWKGGASSTLSGTHYIDLATSSTSSLKIRDYSDNVVFSVEGTTTRLQSASNGYTVVGGSGGYLGFFGSVSPAAKKQTVANVTGSTINDVKTGLNNLIDALKAYNLIG